MEQNQRRQSDMFVASFVVLFIISVAAGIYGESLLVGATIFIIGAVIAYKALSEDKPQESDKTNISITGATLKPYKPRTFETKVAGASYYCDDDDIRGFVGYIEAEPDNEYDDNAIAIYRQDGKMLGHIPKPDILRVKRMMDGCNLACIGFIKDGDVVDYWGYITIIKGDSSFVAKALLKCTIDMVARDGMKALPPEIDIIGAEKPKTKKELLALLQRALDEQHKEA